MVRQTDSLAILETNQAKYYRVYRGRQSWLHHQAYIRLSKAMAIQFMLEENGLPLTGKSIFDFGFGAGAFFLRCPKDSRLFGVELDQENVEAVRNSLCRKGYGHVELQTVAETGLERCELMEKSYDLVVACHVLEHIQEPVELLKKLVSCLAPGGYLVGVVPINETVSHENHLWKTDKTLIEDWVSAAHTELVAYRELDSLSYLLQAAFNLKSTMGRVAAQGVSLVLGIPTALLGTRLWVKSGVLLERSTGAKSGQAVFLLRSLQI